MYAIGWLRSGHLSMAVKKAMRAGDVFPATCRISSERHPVIDSDSTTNAHTTDCNMSRGRRLKGLKARPSMIVHYAANFKSLSDSETTPNGFGSFLACSICSAGVRPGFTA